MSPFRLILAWAVVSLWFAAWHLARARFFPGPGDENSRPPAFLFSESLLLTLFAALWFASLGHGGWPLLFVVLGILIEGPVRRRHLASGGAAPAPTTRERLVRLGSDLIRLTVAGGLLAWRL